MKIFIVDCEDSFTNNILDYLNQTEVQADIIHHSKYESTKTKYCDAFVLAPGPKSPRDMPILKRVVNEYGTTPILGICLGHQAIGEYYGHELIRSEHPMHGISTKLEVWKDDQIFKGIDKNNFHAMRYNSLAVDDADGSELEVLCRDEFGEIMGFKHRVLPLYSFQFHPESIGTPQGLVLFQNWVQFVKNFTLQK